MNDYPEELYYPLGDNYNLQRLDNFDALAEGTRVAIYVFGGIATVKVRREALLIDEDSKIVRGPTALGDSAR